MSYGNRFELLLDAGEGMETWNRKSWLEIRKKYSDPSSYTASHIVLMVDVLIVALSYYLFLSYESILVQILAIMLLSLAFVQLYLLVHEATHNALSKNVRVNDFLGHILSWIISMPYLARKRSHHFHHTDTGHPINDPTNFRAKESAEKLTQRDKNTLNFLWKCWYPVLVSTERMGLWSAAFNENEKVLRSSNLKKEKFYVWLYLVGYAAVFSLLYYFSLLKLYYALYLPAFIVLLVCEELLNLPHHASAPYIAEDKPSLPNMAAASGYPLM